MGSDEADDPLDLGGVHPHAGVGAAFAKPIKAQGPIGIDHDLDDTGIGERFPDSKTGAKTIWLNSQALAILDAVPRRDGCPLVFPNRSGAAPVKLDNWWNAFRRTCSMPDVRIHDLRHSYASTAIMDNVPLATIGKLLGHLLPETTAKYAHLSDDVIADAAQRISGSLAEAIGLRP